MRGISELMFYLSVGAGMALGTSAFTMVGGLFEVAQLVWVVAAISLAALFCAAIALSIGELASMWPSSPAIRTYFKMAFNDRWSLTLIYGYLSFIILAAGVESYMFSLVIRAMLPAASPTVSVLILFGAVMGANLYGLELPRIMQIVAAFGCAAVILVMGVLGVTGVLGSLHGAASPAAPSSTLDGITVLPSAVGMAIFLFVGFEWITPVGLRPQSYARLIPRSMVGAVAVLLVTYVVFAFGIGISLPRDSIAGESIPQVSYFTAVLGRNGVWLAGALAVTAIFSTFNAGLMGGASLLQAMARERTLPKWVATINPDTGAPVGAVLLLGGLAVSSSLIILTFKLQLLAAVIGAANVCFVYAAYMLSVLRLRRRLPAHSRPFRTPLPTTLQWAIAAVLPLIGIASLFSLPEFGVAPAWGVVVCAVLAAALADWSCRRLAAAPPRRAPAPAPLASQPFDHA